MSDSDAQQLIYHTTSTRIEASAGTGKTFQLASRYIALLMLGVAPESIVALTFTRKAAGEFRNRILHALAEGACDQRDFKTNRNELAARIWQIWSGLEQPRRDSWKEAANHIPLLPATVPIVKLAASRGMYPEELYSSADGKELRDYLKLPEQTPAEFARLLKTMVMTMSNLELSTIDSFFNKLVCGNSLELGVNSVSFMAPQDVSSACRSTLNDYLAARTTEDKKRTQFLNMFAELTGGKGVRTLSKLEQELRSHLSLYRETPDVDAWANLSYFAQHCEGSFVCMSPEEAEEWNRSAYELRSLLSHFDDSDFAHYVYGGLKNLASQHTPLSKTLSAWISTPVNDEDYYSLLTLAKELVAAYRKQDKLTPQLLKTAEQADDLLNHGNLLKGDDTKALRSIIKALEEQKFKETKYIEKFCSAIDSKKILSDNKRNELRKIRSLAISLAEGLPAKCLFDAQARTRSLYSLLRDYADAYEQRMTTTGKFSFEDIARKARELMTRDCDDEMINSQAYCREHLAIRTGQKYLHWMLDEFQDTSDDQFETLRPALELIISDSLVPFTAETPRPLPPSLRPFHQDAEHFVAEGSLFVVGDVKQSIYGFRTGKAQSFETLRADTTWSKPVMGVHLTKSFRSSPIIMGRDGFVNDIFRRLHAIEAEDCGNHAVNLSDFTHHETAKNFPGYVEMQVVAREDNDETDEKSPMDTSAYKAISRVLRRLTIKEKFPINGMSIGILTRTNHEAEALVNYLRNDMPELPVLLVKDTLSATFCPLGEMLHHLFRWLQHPRAHTSCSILKASFLSIIFQDIESDDLAWHRLRYELEKHGYTRLLKRLLSHFSLDSLSQEQQKAHKQLISTWLNTARAFDTTGGTLSDWIRTISSLSSQGVASSRYVQVMTMHKSKGLEFDAVILPLMSDDAIDNEQDLTYFRATDDDAILLSPGNKDTRTQYWPGAFDEQTTVWKQRRCQEAYNLLYVAITRARYANYILLNGNKLVEKGKKLSRQRSESGLIRRAFGGSQDEYEVCENLTIPSGCETWFDSLKQNVQEPALPASPPPPLGSAIPRRKHVSPSTAAYDEGHLSAEPDFSSEGNPMSTPSGADFGTKVHECWEEITWLEAPMPTWLSQPLTDEQKVIAAAFRQQDVVDLFTRRVRQEVYNEQSIEAINAENEWVSATIDRLVLTHDAAGRVTAAHIIDFKTNQRQYHQPYTTFEEWLMEHHVAQMREYKKLIQNAFSLPPQSITVSLLSCPKVGQAQVLTYADHQLATP